MYVDFAKPIIIIIRIIEEQIFPHFGKKLKKRIIYF
jgi:hypothetical protein